MGGPATAGFGMSEEPASVPTVASTVSDGLDSRLPHWKQNRAPSAFFVPQFVQNMVLDSFLSPGVSETALGQGRGAPRLFSTWGTAKRL